MREILSNRRSVFHFPLQMPFEIFLPEIKKCSEFMLYRVIEKDGRDLKQIYLNSTCFHRLKPSNKKL